MPLLLKLKIQNIILTNRKQTLTKENDASSKTHIMWRIKIQLQVKLPINEDERADAFRGIPKLRLLAILEYLGVPWASPSFGSCQSLFHSPSNLYPKLENFTTQNSTGNLISSVSERKKNHNIYIGVKTTVFQVLYGSYHLILAIDALK